MEQVLRSGWTSRSTCSRHMELTLPGMYHSASASRARSFLGSWRRKRPVSSPWKPCRRALLGPRGWQAGP
jgi:hypothetical protein